ncbi:hypothetical protein BDP27DRAFT_1332554 [Rhodocollybia butyracea]|uniref:Uncharacterized protein n=1 Tax=Rhodocollybia butyracea TaxID=206335 RepID=A0A9P5PKF0_9AGAR|nr:hypothetical protein BDP27DRAFT_1332554 [Rhodocollybia butyracea]
MLFRSTALLAIVAVAPYITLGNAWSCFCAPDDSAQKAIAPTYTCGQHMSGVSYDNGGILDIAHWYGLSAGQKSTYEGCCLEGGADYHCY